MVEGREGYEVVRVGRRGARREGASVAMERRVRVRLNGRAVASLVASPHDLPALALGHLALAGLVRSRAAVRRVEVREFDAGVRVDVTARAAKPAPRPLPRGPRLPPARVHALMRAMLQGSALYREGGGVHTSALAGPRGLRWIAADVGKVNTLDRLAGEALRRGAGTRGSVLLTTGRLTGAMVGKAVALGCPVLVSHSGPTTGGLGIAEATGATVVGYARGGEMVVYAGLARLAL